MSFKIMSLTYITYCYIYNKKQNLLLGVRVCKVSRKKTRAVLRISKEDSGAKNSLKEDELVEKK